MSAPFPAGALPRRVDELPFFRHVVRRIAVNSGTVLATGKAHTTLELDARGLTPRQIGTVLGATVACPSCGSRVNPFRSRRGRRPERAPEKIGRLFLSATCRLQDSIGCARGSAASNEIDRLVKVILASQKLPPTAPPTASSLPPPKPALPAEPRRSNESNQLGLRGVLT